VIYFIQGGDQVKIGYTENAEQRLKALQCGSPVPLELIATMPGDVGTEAEMHARFSGARVHGEWFQWAGELAAFLARHNVGRREMNDSGITRTHKESFLTIYVMWPLLGGVGVGGVLAVSAFGLSAVLTEGDWYRALITGVAVFCVVAPVIALSTFVYAARDWAGPRRDERMAALQREVIELPAPEQPPRRYDPPELPRNEEARAALGKAIDVLGDRLKGTAAVTVYEQEVESLEPGAEPWVIELYDCITRSFPDKMRRRDWTRLFDGGTGLWSKYVNGTGDRHSQRGILDVWGVIERQDRRGAWRYRFNLATIYGLDPALAEYAKRKAALVDHSPRDGDRHENDVAKGDELTQTTDQTKSRKGGR